MNTNRFLHHWKKTKNPFIAEWSLLYRDAPDADDTTKATPVPEGQIVDDAENLQKTPKAFAGEDAALSKMMLKYSEGLMQTLEGKKLELPEEVEKLNREFNAAVNTLEALDRAEKKFNKGDLRAFEFISWANKIYDNYDNAFTSLFNREGTFGDTAAHTRVDVPTLAAPGAQNKAAFDALAAQEKSNLEGFMRLELKRVFVAVRRDVEAQKEKTANQLKIKVLENIEEKITLETDMWTNNENLKRLVTTEALASIQETLRTWPEKITELKTAINTGVAVPVSDIFNLEDKIYEIYTSRRNELEELGKDITIESIEAKSAKLKEDAQSDKSKELIEVAEKQAEKILEKLNEAEAKLDAAFASGAYTNKDEYEKMKAKLAEGKKSVGKYKDEKVVLEALKKQKDEVVDNNKKSKAALDERFEKGEIPAAEHAEKSAELQQNLELDLKKIEAEEAKASKYPTLSSYIDLIWSDTGDFPGLVDGRKFPRGIDAQIEFARTLPSPFKEQYLKGINYALDQYAQELGVEGFTKVVNQEMSKYEQSVDDFLREFEPKAGVASAYTWHWLSYRSGEQFVEKIKEWAVRRYERNNDRKVGEVGERITKNLRVPLTETLHTDFNSLIHHAEGEEVHKYEESLEHLQNPYEVFKRMRQTENSDEFRAAIQVLCKGGDMRWEDDGFLQKLNTLQHSVRFGRAAHEATKPGEFSRKLQIAFNTLYHSPQLYTEWEKQNESAYTSSKNGFTDKCNKMAESTGMGAYIQGMLRDYVTTKEHGHEPEVDQHEYEGAIEYCAKQGKMSPQDRMYYLIQGMACGLLAPERGKVLDSTLLNDMPALELFNKSSGLTMADIMSIAALDKDKFAPGTQFKAFFTSGILHNQSVWERVQKALSGQRAGMDHDDFYAYSGALETSEMLNLMKRGSAGFTLPKTAMPNATVGFLDYIDVMSHTYHNINNKENHLSRYVSTVLLYRNISYGNMYAKDKEGYFRWRSGDDKVVPRAASSIMRGNGTVGNWSAKQFLEESIEMIKPLDRDGVFDFINKPGAQTTEDVVAFVRKVKARYGNESIFGEPDPADYDSLVNSVGNYVSFIIKTYPPLVEEMFAKARARQAVSGANVDAVEAVKTTPATRAKGATKARYEAGFPALPGEEAEYARLEAERLAELQPGHHGGGHGGH